MLPAGPRGWSQGMVGGGIERRREPYRLGSVVEAGGRRYQSHERTEDDAEFLDVADGDGDAEHHHGRQPGDHECQQRDEQIRELSGDAALYLDGQQGIRPAPLD